MGASTLSVQGDPANKRKRADESEDDTQAKKRKHENDQYNRHCEAYAAAWAQQNNFKALRKINEADEHGKMPEDREALQLGAAAQTAFTGLLEDGRYASNKGSWDFIVKNGQVQLSRLPKTDKEFEDMYGDLFDVLAGGRGAGKGWDSPDGGTVGRGKITIDWDSTEDVNLAYLDKLIALADKKGVEVELGPNTRKFIESNKKDYSGTDQNFLKAFWNKNFAYHKEHDGSGDRGGHDISAEDVRKRINKYDDLLAKNKAAAAQKNNDPEFKAFEQKTLLENDQKKLDKLPDLTAEATKLNTAIAADPNNTDKKLEALEQAISANEKFNQQLVSAQNNFQNDLNAVTSNLGRAQKAEDVTELKSVYDRNNTLREAVHTKIGASHTALTQNNAAIRAQLTDLPQGATKEQKDSFKKLQARAGASESGAGKLRENLANNRTTMDGMQGQFTAKTTAIAQAAQAAAAAQAAQPPAQPVPGARQ